MPPVICSAEGCGEAHYAKTFCKKHYTQVTRHGQLTPTTEREGAKRPMCDAETCGRRDTLLLEGKWWCRKHYRQIKVFGKLTPEREHLIGIKRCKIPGCKTKNRAKGLCAKHYNQSKWAGIRNKLERLKKLEENQ